MRVYVFGLGHIGLPMAVWFALKGYVVTGIDINPAVITAINDGTVNIEEYYQEEHISRIALNLIEKKVLTLATEFSRVDDTPSVFVIAVGIAEKDNGAADLSPISRVLAAIAPGLLPHDLLLLRTTLIPGTIDKLVIPWLQQLNVPVRFAYCPETMMETRAFKELAENPIILAAIDEESKAAAKSFWQSLSEAPIYEASNIKTAELAKVIQNIHRDVNVALINEISQVAYHLNVDIHELITLANTHPRVELLLPGPGVGGYCLPNALGYLQKAVEEQKCPLPLMRTARKVNTARPQKIVEIVTAALQQAGKDITASTVAVVGLAMKDFCADCRHSPALEIASLLIKAGAKVQAFDPAIPVTRTFQTATLQECLRHADCLLILAHQKGIVYDKEEIESLMSRPILVVDTRNVFPHFPGIKVYKP